MVESNGGTSIANATSLLAVVRMSLVSNGSLNAATTQYIGSAVRSGLRPYCASRSAARSSASGCWRNASQTVGASGGSGPVDSGAHFYRSLLIDEHGNPINKRNAWMARSVAYVRLIPPGAAEPTDSPGNGGSLTLAVG